jgi:hypothetical protein
MSPPEVDHVGRDVWAWLSLEDDWHLTGAGSMANSHVWLLHVWSHDVNPETSPIMPPDRWYEFILQAELDKPSFYCSTLN